MEFDAKIIAPPPRYQRADLTHYSRVQGFYYRGELIVLGMTVTKATVAQSQSCQPIFPAKHRTSRTRAAVLEIGIRSHWKQADDLSVL